MKGYFDQLLSHATSLHQQGDLKGAEIAYKQVLKDRPGHPDALHFLGLIYAQQNQFEPAISFFERAIKERPLNPVFQNNLGETYKRKGDSQNALKYFEKATKTDPNFAQGYFNQATIWRSLGDFSKTAELYEKAVGKNPKYFQAYYNLGNLTQEMGNYKSAISYYEKCLLINPNHELAHNNLGIMLQHWDRTEEAIEHYARAIEIDPKFEEAHSNLAKIFEKQGDVEQAMEHYEQMLKSDPNNRLLQFRVRTMCPIIFESNSSIDEYRERISQVIGDFKALSFDPKTVGTSALNTFSDLIYQGRDDLPLKRSLASLYADTIPIIPVRNSNEKPHIGFVVTNGHEGVFTKCMRGLINELSGDKYDISIVCSQPNGQRILEPVIENEAVNFLSIPSQLDVASQKILDAKFDLLHYWEIGTDSTNYLLPFLRLAKVQCASWGWPTTSGIPNVDYFISSKHLETDDSEKFYSEKLVRLEHLPVFYYRPPVPISTKPLEDLDLPTNKNIYLCAQNLKKVHPDFDEIVAGILEKDPEGLILFINDKQENITQLLKERMKRTVSKDFSRIKFMERMSEVDYLSLLKQVHVAIDTLHYGGGANTCYDAFACGTPLITLEGKFHRSRFAYASYRQIGLDECITNSPDEYIERAVEIATNSALRKDLSTKIKEQSKSLFEDPIAVKEFSEFVDSVIDES